ncbi:MAG: hypothetical protein HWE26_15880 [Alteromonadaceae bacterium]|nr:hypothetical protein [Alteromonadaceae bacterium]
MNIEQNSTKYEISDEDCLKVQGGISNFQPHAIKLWFHVPTPETCVEEAEKPDG